MIKDIEVNGVPYSITLSDDMVGPGLKKDENGVVSLDINEEKLVKITYSELKLLRDNSQLTPGSFYRITDYVTTTTQSETQSANQPFDVIVLALSENTLCEDAKAILHEGDTYFADSDLSSWELKYCLDNDKTRFEWADETNGKGVIYYIKDEFNNECPYDFKNIMFKYDDKYYYTFSFISDNDYVEDLILRQDLTNDEGLRYGTYCNIIKPYYPESKILTQSLNNNIFIFNGLKYEYYGCYNNIFNVNCCNNIIYCSCFVSNTFGSYCQSNIFEDTCEFNTFGDRCSSNFFGHGCCRNTFGHCFEHNTFGEYCSDNIFKNHCYSNSFGEYCCNNTFGYYFEHNTFGEYCNSNTFGDNCASNTFIDNCESNSFGNSCTSNTFGVYCCYNIFGNDCERNKFGDNCYTNTFGSSCNDNTFGSSCNSNTFGDKCNRNTFGGDCNSNTFGYNCSSNTFGDNCSKNILKNSAQSISLKTWGISNTFGDSCNNITFGDNCNSNSFGNFCTKNTLGNNCHYNVFGSDYNNMTFGDLTANYKIEGSGDKKKSVTTLSKEFYDDGTGNVVPLKYPDLSTEPSILPYKFMGEYVYEQIIPYTGGTQLSVKLYRSNLENFIEASCIGKTTGVVEIVGYENNILTIKQELPISVEYIRIVYTIGKYPITGLCGDDITYSLDEQGTLTIMGTGSMYEDKNQLGYLKYKDEIRNVIIYNSLIDFITREAFAGFPNLENVEFI